MYVLATGSVDEALASLGDPPSPATADLVRALGDPKRSVRARALATVAEEIARAVDEAGLR